MKVIIAKDYEEMSAKAFEIMAGVVKSNPEAVLGLATGSTPIGLYKNMIADHKENGTSYKAIKTVNLDEYEGLDYSSDQSYVYFMRDNLFDHIDIDLANTNIENGKASASSAVIGNVVTIAADQIDGKVFYCWNITGATPEDYFDSKTTFTMGVFNVTAEAVYKDCECKCHKGGIEGFFYKIVLFFQKLFGQNKVCACGMNH